MKKLRQHGSLATPLQTLALNLRNSHPGICECLEGFSQLAEAEQHAEHAVLLAAGAAALRSLLKAPLPRWQQPDWQRFQARLRKTLGDEK